MNSRNTFFFAASFSLALGVGCAPGLKVGATAPDFTLNDLGGRKVSLSQYAGNPVVLSYFATW